MVETRETIGAELDSLKEKIDAGASILFEREPDYALMLAELEKGSRDYLNTDEKEVIANAVFSHRMATYSLAIENYAGAISALVNTSFDIGVAFANAHQKNLNTLVSLFKLQKRHSKNNAAKRKVIEFWLNNSDGNGLCFEKKSRCIDYIQSNAKAIGINEDSDKIRKWLNKSSIENYFAGEEIKRLFYAATQ